MFNPGISILRMLKPQRRKHLRVKVNGGITVVLSPLLISRKQIIDASLGGLSYLDDCEPPLGSFGLNILAGDGLLFDENIRFEPVPVGGDRRPATTTCGLRPCRLHFQTITSEQECKLRHLLAAQRQIP